MAASIKGEGIWQARFVGKLTHELRHVVRPKGVGATIPPAALQDQRHTPTGKALFWGPARRVLDEGFQLFEAPFDGGTTRIGSGNFV